MNLYLSLGRIWTGTQADAKEAQGGKDFEHIDVPTDKPSLLAFLNDFPRRFPGMYGEPGTSVMNGEEGTSDEVVGADDLYAHLPPRERGPEYQNGDPTRPHLKSRDPQAITTCMSCGRSERQDRANTVATIRQEVGQLTAADLDRVQEAIDARRSQLTAA